MKTIVFPRLQNSHEVNTLYISGRRFFLVRARRKQTSPLDSSESCAYPCIFSQNIQFGPYIFQFGSLRLQRSCRNLKFGY